MGEARIDGRKIKVLGGSSYPLARGSLFYVNTNIKGMLWT